MGQDPDPKSVTYFKRSQKLHKTINKLLSNRSLKKNITNSGLSLKELKGSGKSRVRTISSLISKHGSRKHATISSAKTKKIIGRFQKRGGFTSSIKGAKRNGRSRTGLLSAKKTLHKDTNRHPCHHKRKGKVVQTQQDETSKIVRRVKYLLTRIKLEQNLIDAYSAEGWKGQSREKLRPESELQRAQKQILQFQVGIREAVRQLHLLGNDGSLEDSKVDADGRIHHEDIFCAKCKLQDAARDNDIILCDGFCNRAFHQLCLEPPLRTEEIPPGDEGWLCAVCECKLECLDVVNAYLGTCFDIEDSWQKIFPQAAAWASGQAVVPVDGSPSEDSDDEDYNPEFDGKDVRTLLERGTASSKSTSSTSGGRGSDSSDSDDEDFGVSLYDEFRSLIEGNTDDDIVPAPGRDAIEHEDAVLVHGKRHRREVDYQKLHDEMFGKCASIDELSEDDEWGPRKRARIAREGDQATLTGHALKADGSTQDCERRIRFSQIAVERLRAIFKENPLPSRAVKEGLSKQLELPVHKVTLWFRNARYAAVKKGLIDCSKPWLGKKSADEARNSVQEEMPEDPHLTSLVAVLDEFAEAQSKVERLQKILKSLPAIVIDECEQVMYVPVAELKEKSHQWTN